MLYGYHLTLIATGYMIQPTSKLPFLNCITDVLFMHVPSGKISMGGLFGSDTCFLILKHVEQNIKTIITHSSTDYTWTRTRTPAVRKYEPVRDGFAVFHFVPFEPDVRRSSGECPLQNAQETSVPLSDLHSPKRPERKKKSYTYFD